MSTNASKTTRPADFKQAKQTPDSEKSLQAANPEMVRAEAQEALTHPAQLDPGRVIKLQRAAGNRAVVQLLSGAASSHSTPQKMAAQTGLPESLKAGVENLSGLSMDDVQVHLNSSEPAEMHALGFTQGADIHMAPGQERHLPHEAWHVVQQKQGKVTPDIQEKGAAINVDSALETEADVMGAAASRASAANASSPAPENHGASPSGQPTQVAQRAVPGTPVRQFRFGFGWVKSLYFAAKNRLRRRRPKHEEPKTQIELDRDAELERKLNMDPETQPETKLEPETLPETKLEPETQPETKLEPETQPETKLEPETQPETKLEPETQPQIELEPEPEREPTEQDLFIKEAIGNLGATTVKEFAIDLKNVGGWLGKSPDQIIAWGMREKSGKKGWEDFKGQCLLPKTGTVNEESYRNVVAALFSEKSGRDSVAFINNQGRNARKGVIPREIMTGVKGKKGAAKVDALFANFNKIAFTYTPGNGIPPLAGFMSRKGDCSTLAEMFKVVTQEAGIEGVIVNGSGKGRLVNASQAHGGDTNNEMSGKYWSFGSHVWCEYNGTVYDLLFMKNGADVPATYMFAGKDEYNNCKYELYEGGRAFLTPPALIKMGIDPGQKKGKAFDSVDALKEFVNTHPVK